MLFKNVLRTLKTQYIQLFLLGIIIALSSFIYTAMAYGTNGVLVPTEEYFEEANQEDFAISMIDFIMDADIAFIQDNCTLTQDVYTLNGLKSIDNTCFYATMDNRLNIITDKYDDINIELREHKDVYYDFESSSYKVRFLKETSEINTSFFVEGMRPANDSEIAVSEIFAKNNDLVVGDTLDINDKEYTISGFVLFADYSLALFSADLIFDNTSQTVGLLTDTEFESLSENTGFEIAGDFLNDLTIEEFEENVIDVFRDDNELSYVTNISLTENNMRSGAIYAEIEGGQASGLGLSLIIASIALLIVGIMVSKVLQSQRGPIGILKSMGYTNTQITIPYIFFVAILSFPAIIIGYFLGVLGAMPMRDVYLFIYLLPSNPISQTWDVFIVAVVVPFVFLMGISYLIIKRILNQKPVTLLNPQVTSSSNFLTRKMGKYLKRLKITGKLKHLLLYRNMVKFFVFVVGMFYAAFLVLFSFSMMDVFDRITVDYYENTDHNYIGYCDYVAPCEEPRGNQEKVIELPGIVLEDEEVYLVGLEPDSSIHKLLDSKGNDITSDIEDGLVITKSLSLIKGFKVGDMLLLEIGDSDLEVEVVSITEEYMGSKAYYDRSALGDMISDDNTYYNAIYSDVELSKDDFAVVVSTEAILDQTEVMQGIFSLMFSAMIIASISIGAIIVYILTIMTIEDNFYNISLFKVMGYNNKEIDKMVLGGYLLYGIIVFLVTIPVAYFSFKLFTYFFAIYYEIVFPFEFKIWHAGVSIIMFVIIFYIGAYVAKRKLNKISLQEAMKMYQV